jgi:DNA-binding NarL/FixJ family response regulator
MDITKKFTTLIVEDEAIIAMDIQRRLKKIGYPNSIIKSHSTDAINYLSLHTPNLILCDINIHGERDGIDVAAYVQEYKSIPLIFITALADKGTLDRAKKTLPYGYIIKPFTDKDLISAIEMALYKYSADKNRLKFSHEKVNKMAVNDLSSREYQILEGVLSGQTNAQIAESQFISISTVKFHISNILTKLDVHNRASLSSKILAVFC